MSSDGALLGYGRSYYQKIIVAVKDMKGITDSKH